MKRLEQPSNLKIQTKQHEVLNAYEMVLKIQASCSMEVHLWKKKHQWVVFLSISGSATVLGTPSERWPSIRIPRVFDPTPEMLMSLMLDVS